MKIIEKQDLLSAVRKRHLNIFLKSGRTKSIKNNEFYICSAPVVKTDDLNDVDFTAYYVHFPGDLSYSVSYGEYCNAKVGDIYYLVFDGKNNLLCGFNSKCYRLGSTLIGNLKTPQ